MSAKHIVLHSLWWCTLWMFRCFPCKDSQVTSARTARNGTGDC